MTSTNDTTTAELSVGSRVRTRHSLSKDSEPTEERGVIVEDFAPTLGSVTRDWAIAHRWGVALDNGCLVFRDSGEVWLE